jgi:hypothetical protein
MDEQMYVELKRMNNILAENTRSLQDHMRRTDQNELAIKDIHSSLIELGHKLEAVSVKLNEMEVAKIKKDAISTWKTDTIKSSLKWIALITGISTVSTMIPSIIRWFISLAE